jgi:hypothetical protein
LTFNGSAEKIIGSKIMLGLEVIGTAIIFSLALLSGMLAMVLFWPLVAIASQIYHRCLPAKNPGSFWLRYYS